MYRYDAVDRAIVAARVEQFRDQTRRFLAGRLSEDEFKPLRLQNGLYIQRHAPMLRVAIPYGMLRADQMRTLAAIARDHDRGYGHFTTRQNIQFNWISLAETPDILAKLARVDMHAIQTSGNCVRNVTTDHFAGAAADERLDPRPYCEMMRQWSTLHPEFAHLPRKFKVAFNAADNDRVAAAVHDLAFDLYKDDAGEVRMRVMAGGGQGRTPRIAATLKEDLHWSDMLTYTEAVLRAYNLWGRRDNLYKARIKILIEAIGAAQFATDVEAEWAHLRNGPATLCAVERARVAACFIDPPFAADAEAGPELARARLRDPRFAQWLKRNVHAHKQPGYAAVTLSLKASGRAPGDATAAEMEAAADLMERFSFGELRVSHHQNLVLAHVARRDLEAVYRAADAHGLATPNIGLASDIIACPGGDFCALANARSIPIADAIQARLAAIEVDVGEIAIKISGCINSCGHHHVGHIGVLGVDKHGEEWYQLSIGGRSDNGASIGAILGPAVRAEEVAPAIDRIIERYRALRVSGERFIDCATRLGPAAFKSAAYPSDRSAA
jgi:sulfite reductase (NADPH) hemoprotein beta-component